MQCPNCRVTIRGRALFCPSCGYRLEQSPPAQPTRRMDVPPSDLEAPVEVAWDEPAEAIQPHGCRLTLAVVVVAALVVLAIVGLGAAGVYYGLMDRTQTETRAAAEHYNKGLAYMEEGNWHMAIAELELAIQLDPRDSKSQDKLVEARRRLEAEPTATLVQQEEASAAFLSELRAAYGRGDWQAVFEFADRLLASDPSYHRDEVDEMLFEAFCANGFDLVQQDRDSEAVRMFDRALALRPNDPEALEAKENAALYATGLSFWSADWAQAAGALRVLYARAPGYKDVRQRLYQAQINLGDVLVDGEEWCQAVDAYRGALEIVDDVTIRAKLVQAEEDCANAPPDSDEEGAEGSDGTATPALPDAPSGTFVGRVVEPGVEGEGYLFVRGRVLDKNSRPVAGVRVEIKAWDWSADAVTDGNGQFSFDGLNNPVTYTLSLPDLNSLPLEVPTLKGSLTLVEFREAR